MNAKAREVMQEQMKLALYIKPPRCGYCNQELFPYAEYWSCLDQRCEGSGWAHTFRMVRNDRTKRGVGTPPYEPRNNWLQEEA